GQHCGWSDCRARQQNLVDIVQQKRLASGHKDLLDAKLRGFTSDPLHTPKSQFSSRRSGGGTHATVVTTEVAIEIRVEPKSLTYRLTVFIRHHNRSTTYNPTRTSVFDRCLQQWIPRESTPRFQLRSNARFVADQREQIARPTTAHQSDQIRQ